MVGPPIAGAAVSGAGGPDMTTTADGQFALDVLSNVPFFVSFAAPGYATTYLPDMSLAANVTTDFTSPDYTFAIPSVEVFKQLTQALPGYDPSLALLAIKLNTTGSCTSTGGVTLSSDFPLAKVAYLANMKPVPSATSTQDGQSISALVYNLADMTYASVSVKGGPCKAAPFPHVNADDVSFSDGIVVFPGNAFSQLQIWLQ
jgi:hypothetical protein